MVGVRTGRSCIRVGMVVHNTGIYTCCMGCQSFSKSLFPSTTLICEFNAVGGTITLGQGKESSSSDRLGEWTLTRMTELQYTGT
jgi:hypothetical protein